MTELRVRLNESGLRLIELLSDCGWLGALRSITDYLEIHQKHLNEHSINAQPIPKGGLYTVLFILRSTFDGPQFATFPVL
jgi:hypothetical protein